MLLAHRRVPAVLAIVPLSDVPGQPKPPDRDQDQDQKSPLLIPIPDDERHQSDRDKREPPGDIGHPGIAHRDAREPSDEHDAKRGPERRRAERRHRA